MDFVQEPNDNMNSLLVMGFEPTTIQTQSLIR